MLTIHAPLEELLAVPILILIVFGSGLLTLPHRKGSQPRSEILISGIK